MLLLGKSISLWLVPRNSKKDEDDLEAGFQVLDWLDGACLFGRPEQRSRLPSACETAATHLVGVQSCRYDIVTIFVVVMVCQHMPCEGIC